MKESTEEKSRAWIQRVWILTEMSWTYIVSFLCMGDELFFVVTNYKGGVQQ